MSTVCCSIQIGMTWGIHKWPFNLVPSWFISNWFAIYMWDKIQTIFLSDTSRLHLNNLWCTSSDKTELLHMNFRRRLVSTASDEMTLAFLPRVSQIKKQCGWHSGTLLLPHSYIRRREKHMRSGFLLSFQRVVWAWFQLLYGLLIHLP